MCTFTFHYADGSKIKCERVKSAAYSSGSRVNVSENELVTHPFPMGKALWLFTETGSFCVGHDGLRCVEVTTE